MYDLSNQLDYNDVDVCIKTLFDVVYNKNNSECYYLNQIILSDIDVGDIRKNVSFNPAIIFENAKFNEIITLIHAHK